MRGRHRLGTIALLLCVLGVGATRTATADQEFGWVHTWIYLAGPDFDDFHATYAGTGGTIDRTMLTIDTAGGGVIAANLNMVDIDWPDTWVMPGDTFQYSFNTAFGEVSFVGAELTKGGDTIGFVDPQGIVRDAAGSVLGEFEHAFIPAPGAIVLLATAVVAARRRRAA